MTKMANESWPIIKWQEMFKEIYGDQNRGKTSTEIWSRLTEEISELVSPIENQKIKDIESGLPDLFAWLSSFCEKYGVDLQTCAWKKFEKGCPSCEQPLDCTCLLTDDNHYTKRSSKDLALEHYKKEPNTLDEWQEFFMSLYGKGNEKFPPLAILSRLTEDVGSISRLLRLKEPKDKIEWKIASVFAWIMALFNRYSTAGHGEFKLHEIVWEKYEYRCCKCYKCPCKCVHLTGVFISYAKELESEMEVVKKAIEDTDLTSYVFPDIGPDFSQGRMPAAFDAIEKADAACVLLGNSFSPRVYAEIIELLHRKNRQYIFIYVKESSSRENLLMDLISELEIIHRTTTFRDFSDLKDKVKKDIALAKEMSKKLGH